MLNIRRRRHLLRLFSNKRLVLAVFFLAVSALLFVLVSPIFRFAKTHGFGPMFLFDLTLAKAPPLKSVDNRTNILLLGMGGANHQGIDLTDSIMVVNLSLEKNDIALISLPRDIWSPTLRDKINSAYHYGEIKKKGGGLILAKSIAEEVTGLPIHYGVLVNFAGFTQIIDLLGGIEIEVEHPFTDPKFPIPGKENDDCNGDPEFACRYRTITFTAGWQHMSGERTLEFVRSRYAQGAEGNDFARGKRQQKVLLAIRDKVLKDRLYLNPTKVQELIDAFNDSIETDLTLADYLYLAKIASNIKEENIRQIPLVEGGENGEIRGFLVNPPLWEYDGRWVLIPPNEDFSQIYQYLNCQLTEPSCPITLPDS